MNTAQAIVGILLLVAMFLCWTEKNPKTWIYTVANFFLIILIGILSLPFLLMAVHIQDNCLGRNIGYECPWVEYIPRPK